LVAVTGFVLTIFIDANIVLTLVIPLLLLWFVIVFSRLGSREHSYDMFKVITTIPGGKLKQTVYSLSAGLLIALLLTIPIIVRLIFAGQYESVFMVLSGVVFLPSLAMCLGELTKSNRVFEIVLILLTYAIVNDVTIAMYMGDPGSPSIFQGSIYFALGLSLGTLSVIKRSKWSC
jgi:hypothetical protein